MMTKYDLWNYYTYGEGGNYPGLSDHEYSQLLLKRIYDYCKSKNIKSITCGSLACSVFQKANFFETDVTQKRNTGKYLAGHLKFEDFSVEIHKNRNLQKFTFKLGDEMCMFVDPEK